MDEILIAPPLVALLLENIVFLIIVPVALVDSPRPFVKYDSSITHNKPELVILTARPVLLSKVQLIMFTSLLSTLIALFEFINLIFFNVMYLPMVLNM